MDYIIWNGKDKLKGLDKEIWYKSYPRAKVDTLILKSNYVYFLEDIYKHLKDNNVNIDNLSITQIIDLYFLEKKKERIEEEKNRENLVADVQQLKKDKIEIIKSIADVFESIVV